MVLKHNEPGPKGPMPHGKGLNNTTVKTVVILNNFSLYSIFVCTTDSAAAVVVTTSVLMNVTIIACWYIYIYIYINKNIYSP